MQDLVTAGRYFWTRLLTPTLALMVFAVAFMVMQEI